MEESMKIQSKGKWELWVGTQGHYDLTFPPKHMLKFNHHHGALRDETSRVWWCKPVNLAALPIPSKKEMRQGGTLKK